MKIVILSDDFPPNALGGAGLVAFMQAKELANRGHDVSVITTTQDKQLATEENYEGLKVYRIYTKYNMFFRAYVSLVNLRTIFKVKNILKEIQPDIAHVHNVHQYLSYKVLDYAKQYSKKVFITFHDVMSFHYTKLYPKRVGDKFDYKISWISQLKNFKLQYNPFRNILIKKYLKNVDKKFAVSGALKDALEQNGIGGVEVLHNGLNVHDFKENPDRTREFKDKYDLNNKKVLFFSGRISRAKGIDVCLSLIKEISRAIPEVRLLVAGQKNGYVEEILKREDMRNVRDKIIFTGRLNREDVVSAYYSSDLIPVLSTYLDPFPTTNLEAMATRKPVLGTLYGGTSEIIKDGENGFIIDPNDFNNVLEKALIFIENEDVSKKFGKVGFERLNALFLIKNQVNKLEEMYDV
ncbi:MAG: glycosyltransferase family 4 protein [Minisyncoccota bacterium]